MVFNGFNFNYCEILQFIYELTFQNVAKIVFKFIILQLFSKKEKNVQMLIKMFDS